MLSQKVAFLQVPPPTSATAIRPCATRGKWKKNTSMIFISLDPYGLSQNTNSQNSEHGTSQVQNESIHSLQIPTKSRNAYGEFMDARASCCIPPSMIDSSPHPSEQKNRFFFLWDDWFLTNM